ncbi:hypothetical protein H9P43_008277 [Blastocladiella emersonii ATCC 22665]|nr:hypothetical protein H9P43_008277 [Blastocladiella emersonii ATCC 22665]
MKRSHPPPSAGDVTPRGKSARTRPPVPPSPLRLPPLSGPGAGARHATSPLQEPALSAAAGSAAASASGAGATADDEDDDESNNVAGSQSALPPSQSTPGGGILRRASGIPHDDRRRSLGRRVSFAPHASIRNFQIVPAVESPESDRSSEDAFDFAFGSNGDESGDAAAAADDDDDDDDSESDGEILAVLLGKNAQQAPAPSFPWSDDDDSTLTVANPEQDAEPESPAAEPDDEPAPEDGGDGDGEQYYHGDNDEDRHYDNDHYDAAPDASNSAEHDEYEHEYEVPIPSASPSSVKEVPAHDADEQNYDADTSHYDELPEREPAPEHAHPLVDPYAPDDGLEFEPIDPFDTPGRRYSWGNSTVGNRTPSSAARGTQEFTMSLSALRNDGNGGDDDEDTFGYRRAPSISSRARESLAPSLPDLERDAPYETETEPEYAAEPGYDQGAAAGTPPPPRSPFPEDDDAAPTPRASQYDAEPTPRPAAPSASAAAASYGDYGYDEAAAERVRRSLSTVTERTEPDTSRSTAVSPASDRSPGALDTPAAPAASTARSSPPKSEISTWLSRRLLAAASSAAAPPMSPPVPAVAARMHADLFANIVTPRADRTAPAPAPATRPISPVVAAALASAESLRARGLSPRTSPEAAQLTQDLRAALEKSRAQPTRVPRTASPAPATPESQRMADIRASLAASPRRGSSSGSGGGGTPGSAAADRERQLDAEARARIERLQNSLGELSATVDSSRLQQMRIATEASAIAQYAASPRRASGAGASANWLATPRGGSSAAAARVPEPELGNAGSPQWRSNSGSASASGASPSSSSATAASATAAAAAARAPEPGIADIEPPPQWSSNSASLSASGASSSATATAAAAASAASSTTADSPFTASVNRFLDETAERQRALVAEFASISSSSSSSAMGPPRLLTPAHRRVLESSAGGGGSDFDSPLRRLTAESDDVMDLMQETIPEGAFDLDDAMELEGGSDVEEADADIDVDAVPRHVPGGELVKRAQKAGKRLGFDEHGRVTAESLLRAAGVVFPPTAAHDRPMTLRVPVSLHHAVALSWPQLELLHQLCGNMLREIEALAPELDRLEARARTEAGNLAARWREVQDRPQLQAFYLEQLQQYHAAAVLVAQRTRMHAHNEYLQQLMEHLEATRKSLEADDQSLEHRVQVMGTIERDLAELVENKAEQRLIEQTRFEESRRGFEERIHAARVRVEELRRRRTSVLDDVAATRTRLESLKAEVAGKRTANDAGRVRIAALDRRIAEARNMPTVDDYRGQRDMYKFIVAVTGWEIDEEQSTWGPDTVTDADDASCSPGATITRRVALDEQRKDLVLVYRKGLQLLLRYNPDTAWELISASLTPLRKRFGPHVVHQLAPGIPARAGAVNKIAEAEAAAAMGSDSADPSTTTSAAAAAASAAGWSEVDGAVRWIARRWDAWTALVPHWSHALAAHAGTLTVQDGDVDPASGLPRQLVVLKVRLTGRGTRYWVDLHLSVDPWTWRPGVPVSVDVTWRYGTLPIAQCNAAARDAVLAEDARGEKSRGHWVAIADAYKRVLEDANPTAATAASLAQ